MVTLKKLFVATSLLLSGVAAAPFPASELSVAAAEVRAINDFAIESRDLNDIAEIEKRKPKPKTTDNSKATSTKAATTSKATSTNAATTSKATSSATASASKSSSASGSACAMPTKRPRSLERRMGPLKPASNPKDIDEDQYLLASKLPEDKTVVVTNLSGCTAIFFWDANNAPSTFHIFCGDENQKAEEAMDMVAGKAKAYSIVASEKTRYDNAKNAIDTYMKNNERDPLQEEKQDTELYKVGDGMKRIKLTVTAGSRAIKREEYTGTSQQC